MVDDIYCTFISITSYLSSLLFDMPPRRIKIQPSILVSDSESDDYVNSEVSLCVFLSCDNIYIYMIIDLFIEVKWTVMRQRQAGRCKQFFSLLPFYI